MSYKFITWQLCTLHNDRFLNVIHHGHEQNDEILEYLILAFGRFYCINETLSGTFWKQEALLHVAAVLTGHVPYAFNHPYLPCKGIEEKVSYEPLIQYEIDSSLKPISALFSWWFLRNWFISALVHKTKTPLLNILQMTLCVTAFKSWLQTQKERYKNTDRFKPNKSLLRPAGVVCIYPYNVLSCNILSV